MTKYTGKGIDHPEGITAGPDGALWFTNLDEQLDRAHHHFWGRDQLHRFQHRLSGGDHLGA